MKVEQPLLLACNCFSSETRMGTDYRRKAVLIDWLDSKKKFRGGGGSFYPGGGGGGILPSDNRIEVLDSSKMNACLSHCFVFNTKQWDRHAFISHSIISDFYSNTCWESPERGSPTE